MDQQKNASGSHLTRLRSHQAASAFCTRLSGVLGSSAAAAAGDARRGRCCSSCKRTQQKPQYRIKVFVSDRWRQEVEAGMKNLALSLDSLISRHRRSHSPEGYHAPCSALAGGVEEAPDEGSCVCEVRCSAGDLEQAVNWSEGSRSFSTELLGTSLGAGRSRLYCGDAG